MKLIPFQSPYIRKHVSVARMMTDVLIALFPILVLSIIFYGWDAIYVYLISIGTMLSIELISNMIIKWPKDMKVKELFSKEGFGRVRATFTINNILAPMISAYIYAMLLPAGCDWYVVFIGAAFGMFFGKMIWGGLGQNIFNPAATGRIFVAVCFGDTLAKAYPGMKGFDVVTGATPLGVTKSAGLAATGQYSLLDMFLGTIPGSMGEVFTILILVGALYLLIRRSADFRAMLSYVVGFSVIAFVAVLSYKLKFDEGNVGEMFLYQILGGGFLFGAVYMITDPVTSPVTKFGRVFYGLLGGALAAMIRFMGAYPEGVCFSILIVNMLTPCIDYFMKGRRNTYTWQQCVIAVSTLAVLSVIVSASVCRGWF